MLKVERINVEIQLKKLVSNISFEIENNLVLGIVGPNGAGKTTLLKSIANLIKYEGEISFQDIPLSDLSLSMRTDLISYCGSADEIMTELFVEDVLSYSRYGKDEDQSLKERVIELFELKELLKRRVNSLSGGERQRLNLACSLYQDSKIILLDEPTNYLDPRHVDLLEDIIKNEFSNKVVIIVSHDINFLLDISDRIIGLKEGELMIDNSTKSLFNDKALDKIFDKKFLYINECQKMVVR